MEHQNKIDQGSRLSKLRLLVFGGVVAVICIVIALVLLMRPERSVANFCKVAKEEKGSFQANTGYAKLLNSFKKLDEVAPEDIHSDTTLIVKGYDSIVNDPSKAVASELGISSSQARVSDYITKNCPDF